METESKTLTLRCDCGTTKTISVTSDQMVFCNKCDTRLRGQHVIR